MERSSIWRWALLGVALVLFWTYGRKLFSPSKASELQPLGLNDQTAQPDPVANPAECTLDGGGFKYVFSARGASLRHATFTDPRYLTTSDEPPLPLDLVTTSTNEGRMPLRTDLHLPLGDDKQQVAYDNLDWKLSPAADAKTCVFTYADKTTKLTKTVSLTGKPYEVAIDVEVQNLSSEEKVHRFTAEQTDWRTKKEMEGNLGRQKHSLTEVVLGAEKTLRHSPGEFEPSDFKKPEFTAEKWKRAAGEAKFADVSSAFFAKVIAPVDGPAKPFAEALIEEAWDTAHFPVKDQDPSYGYYYRGRLTYPEQKLAPNAAVTYKTVAYMGPKDRDHLAIYGHGATEVLNLGFFGAIARVLVAYLRWIHGIIGNWGWSIVLLTISVRTLLFPLSLTQIKSSMAMRKLKPEMDAINERYKDDAAQKGLAIQELWRKNKVTNPVLGCLPMVAQMPVWWAFYTALQTAVELYHVPFGPVIPDLTSPGLYYIIPVVLGAASLVQQRLMPAQGDMTQQKTMMVVMPLVFTVMMLFLPAGLGVYMLTNSLLAITQQLAVERFLKRNAAPAGEIMVREKDSGDGDKPAALGKGKSRARG